MKYRKDSKYDSGFVLDSSESLVNSGITKLLIVSVATFLQYFEARGF